LGLYLPSEGNFKAQCIVLLHNALQLSSHLIDEAFGSRVILLSDFNIEPRRLDKLIGSKDGRFARLKSRDSNLSRFPLRGRAKALDHILARPDLSVLLKKPRVIQRIALSDHRPVISIIRQGRPTVQIECRLTY
jgi:endonuclease/exonuclease/phosphatase family metal-dependent hydrolase